MRISLKAVFVSVTILALILATWIEREREALAYAVFTPAKESSRRTDSYLRRDAFPKIISYLHSDTFLDLVLDDPSLHNVAVLSDNAPKEWIRSRLKIEEASHSHLKIDFRLLWRPYVDIDEMDGFGCPLILEAVLRTVWNHPPAGYECLYVAGPIYKSPKGTYRGIQRPLRKPKINAGHGDIIRRGLPDQ